MNFIFFAFLLAVFSWVFSILAWRLKKDVFFWIGVSATGLLLVFYLFNIEFLIHILSDIDSLVFGVFILTLLGIPVYFLIASKMKSSNSSNDVITEDYLNSIIESEEKEIDYD